MSNDVGNETKMQYVFTGYGEDIVARVRAEADDALGVRHSGDLVDQLEIREAVHVHLRAQHHDDAVSSQLDRKNCRQAGRQLVSVVDG